MSQPLQKNPFVVDALKPEGLGGKGGGVYQLTATSVNPTRVIGRDEVGMPIEDTIPTVPFRFMVHPCGAINKVPIRTGSVPSMEPEAQKYEMQVMTDLIGAGWIPLEMCPYSTAYTHITRGPFVKPPAGAEDCGGAPGGCQHMKAVMEERTKRAAAKHKAEHDRVYAMKHEDTQKLIDGLTEGLGQVLARQNDAKANRERLKAGKGEEG